MIKFNGFRRFARIRMAAFLWASSSSLIVAASPALEGQGVSVKKTYIGGGSISLSCDHKSMHLCMLETKIKGRKRKIKLNFDDYGIAPDFERIRLYVLSDDGEKYSFRVSVDCEDADMELVPDSKWSADCLAGFTVTGGKIDGSPYVQIYPVTTQTLYRSIKSP